MAFNLSIGEGRFVCPGTESGVGAAGGGVDDVGSALEGNTFREFRPLLEGGALEDPRFPPGASMAAIKLSSDRLVFTGTEPDASGVGDAVDDTCSPFVSV